MLLQRRAGLIKSQEMEGGARESNARIRLGRRNAIGAATKIHCVPEAANHINGGLTSAGPMEANAWHCAHCISLGNCRSCLAPEEISEDRCVTACTIPNCCDSNNDSASSARIANWRSFTRVASGPCHMLELSSKAKKCIFRRASYILRLGYL